MTNAERQRRFKARLSEAGFVQVNLWVTPESKADFERAAELVRGRPGLTVARLVDIATGRLIGLKAK